MNATHRRVATALAVAGSVAAAATPAAAQSPALNAYSGRGPSVQAQVDTPSHNTLPFTGLDVAFVAGAGFALGGAGFALRRAARARQSG